MLYEIGKFVAETYLPSRGGGRSSKEKNVGMRVQRVQHETLKVMTFQNQLDFTDPSAADRELLLPVNSRAVQNMNRLQSNLQVVCKCERIWSIMLDPLEETKYIPKMKGS